MPANRNPIFTGTIFRWDTTLTSAVAPRVISTQVPILLGSSGDYGALITHIRCLDLGDDVATVVFFYTKRLLGDDLAYRLVLELQIEQATGTSLAAANTETVATLPVIPLFDGNVRGLHLAANTELYCALGTSVTEGKAIHVTGGLYELQT